MYFNFLFLPRDVTHSVVYRAIVQCPPVCHIRVLYQNKYR